MTDCCVLERKEGGKNGRKEQRKEGREEIKWKNNSKNQTFFCLVIDVHVDICGPWCVRRLEGTWGCWFSPSAVFLPGWDQVVMLGSRYLNPLSHLISPDLVSLNRVRHRSTQVCVWKVCVHLCGTLCYTTELHIVCTKSWLFSVSQPSTVSLLGLQSRLKAEITEIHISYNYSTKM